MEMNGGYKEKTISLLLKHKKIISLSLWGLILVLGLLIILKSDTILIASTKSLNLIGLIISAFSILGFLFEMYIRKR